MDVITKRRGRPVSEKYRKLHNLIPNMRTGDKTVIVIYGEDHLKKKYNAMQVAYVIAKKHGVRVKCKSTKEGVIITRV